MTALTKPVRRRTVLDPKLGRSAAGEITVTLYPGNVIAFRKLKSRHEVQLPLASCYALALKAEARAKAEERKRRRR